MVGLLQNNIRINAVENLAPPDQLVVTGAVWLAHIQQVVTNVCGPTGA